MHLALRMGRTVRELLASMDGNELAEWRELWRQSPWSEERADKRAAIVSWTAAVGLWSSETPLELKDFLARPLPEEAESSEQDAETQATLLTAGLNAKRKDDG